MKRKLISIILMICIFSFVFASSVFAQSTVDSSQEAKLKVETISQKNSEIQETNDKIYKTITDNAIVTANGMSIVNDAKFIKDLSSLDLLSLQKNAEAKGAVFTEPLTAKSLAKIIKDGIEKTNLDIARGEIKILKNGTLIKSNDNNFYLQGGSTYDVTYWWGKRRYKSTYYANLWNRDLNRAAALNGGAAVIAGAVFGGVGAIPNGLTSAYCWYLASDVAYYNSLSSRGIVADINWWLTYSMRTQ